MRHKFDGNYNFNFDRHFICYMLPSSSAMSLLALTLFSCFYCCYNTLIITSKLNICLNKNRNQALLYSLF